MQVNRKDPGYTKEYGRDTDYEDHGKNHRNAADAALSFDRAAEDRRQKGVDSKINLEDEVGLFIDAADYFYR